MLENNNSSHKDTEDAIETKQKNFRSLLPPSSLQMIFCIIFQDEGPLFPTQKGKHTSAEVCTKSSDAPPLLKECPDQSSSETSFE